MREGIVADVGRLGGKSDVFPDGERPEQLHALECAPDAQACPAGRTLPGDVDTVQFHGALVGGLKPADDVEHRRLAGAVRADESGDPSAVSLEINAVEGDEATEANNDARGDQTVHGFSFHQRPREASAALTIVPGSRP